MTNYEIKMPANYAAIDAEEMTYLVGGETTGWQMFKDVGTLFNYIARVFSAGSSIINNVVTIVDTVKKLNDFFPKMGETTKYETVGQNHRTPKRPEGSCPRGAFYRHSKNKAPVPAGTGALCKELISSAAGRRSAFPAREAWQRLRPWRQAGPCRGSCRTPPRWPRGWPPQRQP